MSQLTKNFWRHEMRCKGKNCDGQGNNCGFDTMDHETLRVAQAACDHFARQLGVPRVICHVTSAARCPAHNKNVGSTPQSQHLLGRAMDIWIVGVSPQELYDYFVTTYPDKYGVGLYGTFTHIDTRTNGPARWTTS